MKKRMLVIGTQCVKKQSEDFAMSLKETFCNSTSLTFINKCGAGAVVHISTGSTRLPGCFSKGNLKRQILDIDLTTCFGVRNLRNTCAIRFILFFFENVKRLN